MIHVLQGFAGACKSPYPGRFRFSGLPCVAAYCAPGGVRMVSEAGGWHPSDFLACGDWKDGRFGMIVHEPLRHGDAGVDGLVASPLAATASSSARSFPLLCGPPVLECPLTFFHRTSWWRSSASRILSHRSLFATGSLR